MTDRVMTATVDVIANEHLRGPFAPVHDELDVRDLPVRGRIPEGLSGTYLRNGPNPQFRPLGSYSYPFDGDGMVHAVELGDGRARYRNRWVVTRGLAAERRVGRALYGGSFMPVPPDPTVLRPGDDPGPTKNVANTSVIRFRDRILALYEGGLPYVLTPALDTVGELDLGGRLPGAMTAHPKLDPIWDELVWFRYDLVPPYLVVGTVGPNGAMTRRVEIELPQPVMMHDFAVTDRHVVLFDSPALLDVDAPTRGEPVLRWREARGTRVGVLSREATSDETMWIPIENCFAMHVLNAFSTDAEIVVDYIYRRALGMSWDGPGSPENVPRLHRLTIDPHRRSVRDELVDDRPCEFPRIDDRRSGLEHRYGYVPASTRGGLGTRGAAFDALVQHDFTHGTATEHRFPEGVVVGEAVFAPDPQGSGELDGWLLAYSYDTTRDATELVVIDAADFAALPVAVVPMPRRVPVGLHGTWIPA